MSLIDCSLESLRRPIFRYIHPFRYIYPVPFFHLLRPSISIYLYSVHTHTHAYKCTHACACADTYTCTARQMGDLFKRSSWSQLGSNITRDRPIRGVVHMDICRGIRVDLCGPMLCTRFVATRIQESSHTCEGVLSHCQKCEGLISHVRRSYDTHRNLKREVMPCTCKSHVKHNEGVMSHVKRSHIIHAKELCDKDQKVVAHTQDARQAEGLLPRSCCAPLAVSKSPYEKKFLFFSFCIKTGRMSCLEAILLPRPTGMSVPSFISTHVDS